MRVNRQASSANSSTSRRQFLKHASTALFIGGTLSGCHELSLTKWFDKEDALNQNVREAIRGEEGHSKLIGDYIKIAESTLGYIKVQGVGLVTGLREGMGEDPPASPLRTRLLEDLRREEIPDPNSYLRDSTSCLVVVTAYIPPIVRKGDKMDIEVKLPAGSKTKSLDGGWLNACRLSEHALLEGQVRQGSNIAIAAGPILVDSITDAELKNDAGMKRGLIPGGGRYTGDDRQLTVAIRSDYRTVRMSQIISNRIGRRFYDYDSSGNQRLLADAKSNAHLELIVHDRYRDNYPRYLQVIRHMSLTETPVAKHLRMKELEDQIMFGPTSEKAALQLEAAGTDGIPILKKGLTSKSPEARFRAAEALAYLGERDGAEILRDSAEKEPAFRIFALAALAAYASSDSANALRDLMGSESQETRYGAFRALSTMTPDDVAIAGTKMPGHFSLHLIESSASPFIHVTRRKKAEVVLFGADQEFQLPIFVKAGSEIMVKETPTNDGLLVKRIAVGGKVYQKQVSKRIADVIHAASELGASYPDIVQMLVQAQKQHNLPGEIAIDELPRPGRVYHRKPEDMRGGTDQATPVPIGNDGLMPNLFDEQPNKPIIPSSNSAPPVVEQAQGPNSFEVL